MKKWNLTLAARIVAGVLCMIFAMGTILGAGGVATLFQYNAFNDGGAELFDEAANYLMNREISLVGNALSWHEQETTPQPTPQPQRTEGALLSDVTPEPTQNPTVTPVPDPADHPQMEQIPERTELPETMQTEVPETWSEIELPISLESGRTNFRFAVLSQAGELLLTNGDPSGCIAYRERPLTVANEPGALRHLVENYPTEDAAREAEFGLHRNSWVTSATIVEVEDTWRLDAYYRLRELRTVQIAYGIDGSFPVVDRYSLLLPLVNTFIACRSWAIPVTAVCLALTVATFIFLLVSAGHRTGTAEVSRNWFDKVPLEVVILAMGAVLAMSERLLTYRTMTALGLFLPMLLALGLLFCMTFAVRCKTRTLVKGTLLYWACRWAWAGVRWLGYVLKNLPLIWKTVLIWGGLSLVELGMMGGYARGPLVVFWLLEKLVLTAVIFAFVIGLKKLQDGARRMADGDMAPVPEKFLFPSEKRHAQYLNSIGKGAVLAAERQLKSERMKTELITNVSHDIKTPLTSLISYVDLLKKEGLASENAPGYVDVLDRQSQRLKKLTEDLVEASKASTGNMTVTKEDTDVNLLLSQGLGEYAERLAAANLVPVTTLDPSEPHIQADGRLLWRVFDNLLSNVCKYALPGTRVYLSTEARAGKVQITFRNVSRESLNISAEELMERFVRGDVSRSTEGSGLGLSIARSLTELNGGTLELTIDGDLFKATLVFDKD